MIKIIKVTIFYTVYLIGFGIGYTAGTLTKGCTKKTKKIATAAVVAVCAASETPANKILQGILEK